MCVYVSAKFEVSSIILTRFKQGEGGNFTPPPPTSKQTPKKPIQIRVESPPPVILSLMTDASIYFKALMSIIQNVLMQRFLFNLFTT